MKLTVNLADKYPPVIKRQFFDYLGRADMNMALALFEQPSTILSREICFQLHNCMYDTSMFSCFLRYIFNKDIEDTTEPGTLLRGNNAATMTASTFLVKFGSDIASNIVKELVDKIDNGYDETENIHIFAIKTIISNCHDLPLAMKIIIYNVFRATRRKYPNHRIPLIAIGSILMLRMFIPILSQNEKTKFLVQGLMNAFIFRYDKVNDSINEMSNKEMINPEMNEETKRKNYDQKILYKVAEFICQIINIDDGDYNHRINFRRIDFEGIIKYIADNFDPISEKVKEVGNIKNIESNPLIPSFMELIENIFTGNERDFSCILETNSLFDINV
ncbi:hypothetical protein TRFO_05515 [Tritrichomonas foetus]|uniref:Ras-GAP domain-containing protein n=1 Tax=Tritrichomonas foetus TaxID=1144522 RepID=A0A1J4K640_9EUKA|nr:hypothetical protein TRFO_05515 [Tritrichomonas foetus]|eukprot:OHT06344.1 hypothetical protein TRFO_05515 [Tritrichomonas foetus]